METRAIGKVFLCNVQRIATPTGIRGVTRLSSRAKSTLKMPTTSASEHGRFRSDAETQIDRIPVIEVKGYAAVCDGGGGALGHPIEYIQLDTVSKEPQVCKYCGLRYIKAPGNHFHHH